MQNQSKLRSWSKEEDDKLCRQIGTVKPNWEAVAKESGLRRSANSCRLRWENHLKPGDRPDGKLTDEEKLLILEYRHEYGKNRWAKIAKNLLPGRRDNDVKNYWHSLAKRAKREGRDVDGDAFRKRAELVEAIRAAGKFSMDYSSSICPDAFEKLKELLPDLAAAGGGAVAEAAASSSITSSASDLGISNDLASSSAGTDIGAADAEASCYSVEFGSGRVGLGDFANNGEVDQVILREQFPEALRFNPSNIPTEVGNPEELISSGLVDDGGGPTGFVQVPAAAYSNTSTQTGNQGWRQMQGSEYSTPAEVDLGFTMNYSSLISDDAYDLLKELFPHIAGGAADSSPTDGKLDAGTPGRVDRTVFSPYVATTEVDQLTPDVETPQSRGAVERQLQKGFTTRFLYYGGDPGAAPGSDPVPEAEPVQQQLVKTGLFHRPTGFNQLPAALGIASTETSNQTSHMQVEQQGLNGGCLDHGGGPAEFNQATVAAFHNIG